jgi:hypothetical protein
LILLVNTVSSPEQRAALAGQIRDEAHALLAGCSLFTLLERAFEGASVTGSASYDLMVRRQIDIQLAVEADRWRDWLAFGTPMVKLFTDLGMPPLEAAYTNRWALPEPQDPGLGWRLRLNAKDGQTWQIDIAGWDPFDYAVRQARDFSLRTDLAACDRDLILRLKADALVREAGRTPRVTSFDIYRFAIEGTGDTLADLDRWKRQQG